MRGRHLGRQVDHGSQRGRDPEAVDHGDIRFWNVVPMNDDLEVTEPHPLRKQPIAVDPEGLAVIVIVIEILAVLVEPTAARHQLPAARRASLKVATRVVRSTTDDSAVSPPIPPPSRAGLVPETNMSAPPAI